MHKIKKGPLLGIIIYTITLTILILFSFNYFIQKSGTAPYASSNLLYLPKTVQSFDELKESEVSIREYPISATSIKSYYQSSFYDNLPLLIAVIIFIILASTSILWFYIRHKETLKTKDIANNLRALPEFDGVLEDQELQNEYDELQQYVSQQQHDYEIMHSYIMHEQKNLIALIRAKLSLQQDHNLDSDVQSLANSIDDILTLSTSKTTSLEQLDFALVCASVVDQYHAIYPSLRFEFDEDYEYLIQGKEHWLRRAVDNLINNAIKYGNQKEITVILTQKKQCIQLEVQDHGQGIAHTELDHIFDFRYQIQELKKDGYGIGLSLVKHVCDLCNGAIWIESTLQQGTSILMAFPLLKIN